MLAEAQPRENASSASTLQADAGTPKSGARAQAPGGVTAGGGEMRASKTIETFPASPRKTPSKGSASGQGTSGGTVDS
jgi:hypothetical protein